MTESWEIIAINKCEYGQNKTQTRKNPHICLEKYTLYLKYMSIFEF